MIHVLDLNFLGLDHAIGAFLIETSDGPVLIETGPYSTFPALAKGLKKYGYQQKDIRHVFLTHIHLDHAGAAWAFAQTGAKIYLHPFGAGHMADPTKLMDSATRIYGDQMDALWGRMEKIDPSQLEEAQDTQIFEIGDTHFQSIHTPGHARHHIAWLIEETLFAGDVAGVKIGNGPVVPPCPPPDINLKDWNASIDKILKLPIRTLYLTHFGPILNIEEHLAALQYMLNDWASWMYDSWKSGKSAAEITPLFSAYTQSQLAKLGVDEKGQKQYEAANPSWMSVAGLIRYWKTQEG